VKFYRIASMAKKGKEKKKRNKILKAGIPGARKKEATPEE